MRLNTTAMRSRLYECRVMHHRLAPRNHRFEYRIFMLALDLDELAVVDRRLRLLSVNAANLFSLREDDYLPIGGPVHNPSAQAPAPAGGGTLKERVVRLLTAHGVGSEIGRVELLTLPRIAGYAFNPVSFFFCYDTDGRPAAAVAEVTNTFREVKPYVISADAWRAGAFRRCMPKHFYVSPFSAVDVAFDFKLRPPEARLAIGIDDVAGGVRTVATTLTGSARPLDDATLAAFALKYPWLTLRVITAIHWQAAILWLKRVPWFPKIARAGEQRDVLRPHRSLHTAN